MDSHTIISGQDLTKIYKLYDKSIDRVKEAFSPFRRVYHRPFYALRDVSLQISKGETIGIVGKNGSGKSTLLQLVCGILQPTSGTIDVKGRISALLELGAGFNPEFTGRENVYLNGSILGLSRSTINEHMDDILSFADIGEFVDQPVKLYSSGMYVRLAFAVAINVEPDILVVDEALSVGDEAFQRKCFSRINAIQEKGCTILFVSHSAGSIVELCSRAMVFDNGQLLLTGSPKRVVSLYQKMLYASPAQVEVFKKEWMQYEDRLHLEDIKKIPSGTIDEIDGESLQEEQVGIDDDEGFDQGLEPASTINYEHRGAVIEHPHLVNTSGDKVNNLRSGDHYWYCYTVTFDKPVREIYFGMMIKTIKGVEISGYSAPLAALGIGEVEAGSVWSVRFPFACRLNPGMYFLNAGVLSRDNGEEIFLDRRIDAAMFRVRHKRNEGAMAMADLIDPPEVKQSDKTGEDG